MPLLGLHRADRCVDLRAGYETPIPMDDDDGSTPASRFSFSGVSRKRGYEDIVELSYDSEEDSAHTVLPEWKPSHPPSLASSLCGSSPVTNVHSPYGGRSVLLNASYLVPAHERNDSDRCAVRNDVLIQLISALNASNLTGVITLGREYICEDVDFLTPDMREPCKGRIYLLLLVTVLLTVYSNGRWIIEDTEARVDAHDLMLEDSRTRDMVRRRMQFSGACTCATPMNDVFHCALSSLDSSIAALSNPTELDSKLRCHVKTVVKHSVRVDTCRNREISFYFDANDRVKSIVTVDCHLSPHPIAPYRDEWECV